MARSFSGGVTQTQGEGAVLGFFPIDNAVYIIAFGTHTKMGSPASLAVLSPRVLI